MNVPSNLKYSEEHEWIRVDADNIAYIGVTDYAQDQLGDIVYVDVEAIDETLEKDESFGSIEAVKTVSELFLPVSGKILELNEALEDDPELVNSSPYENGWIIKLEMTDLSQLDTLMSADAYTEFVEKP
jgi:glycine cleavage system H protein